MKQRGSLLKDMSILLFFSALVRAFFAFTCLNFFASAMNLRLFDGAHIWLYRGAVNSEPCHRLVKPRFVRFHIRGVGKLSPFPLHEYRNARPGISYPLRYIHNANRGIRYSTGWASA